MKYLNIIKSGVAFNLVDDWKKYIYIRDYIMKLLQIEFSNGNFKLLFV